MEARQGGKVRVAVTQMRCSTDLWENVRKAESLVREAAAQGANVVLLQELFSGRYWCQFQDARFFELAAPADPEKNVVLSYFKNLAKELGVVLPVSFFERANRAHFNSLAMIDADGAILGVYRKTHIPDGPGYQEKYYFNPGDTGFTVFRTRFAVLGVGICWDQWFPETARCLALQGAEFLLFPTAIGSEPPPALDLDSQKHWQTTMQGHSAANLCPVLASNRTGVEDQITFYGTSFITDNSGQILKQLGRDEEGFLVQEFDLEKLALEKAAWGIFRDRRPEHYSPLVTSDGKNNFSLRQMGILPALTVPLVDHFFMPPEFGPQEAIWMAFPTRGDIWRDDGFYAQVAFLQVAAAIARFQAVRLLVPLGQYKNVVQRVGEMIADAHRVRVIEMSYDDAWMRDIGPSFLVNDDRSELRGVHWNFNAWGGIYASWENDILVGAKCLELAGARRYKCPLILEGGSFTVDGEGTLITTEECLLHTSRNPQLSKADIEAQLKLYLGVQKVIWLPRGLYGDSDTNGHVDNICAFVRPGEVVLAWCDNPADPQFEISMECLSILESTKDARGRALRIHKLSIPSVPICLTETEVQGIRASPGNTITRTVGERLAASYVNFLIINGAVIAPAFGDVKDDEAKQVLESCFPDREIVMIPSREILLGGGNIHCITQQEPKLY